MEVKNLSDFAVVEYLSTKWFRATNTGVKPALTNELYDNFKNAK